VRCAGCRRAGDRPRTDAVSSFNHHLVPFCAKYEVDTRICIRRLSTRGGHPSGRFLQRFTMRIAIYTHGTQSQIVSEPSSRGTTPSPRAHVRCVAARAPGPTEHALGPKVDTHGRSTRQDGEGRPKQCTLRASHSPGRPRQRSGRHLCERAGIRQESGTFWFSSRFRSVGVA
jgi:hypothetical protein